MFFWSFVDYGYWEDFHDQIQPQYWGLNSGTPTLKLSVFPFELTHAPKNGYY